MENSPDSPPSVAQPSEADLIPVPGLETDSQLSQRVYPLPVFPHNTHRYAVRAIEPASLKLLDKARTGIVIGKLAERRGGGLIFKVRNIIDGNNTLAPQIAATESEALRLAAWLKTQFRSHKIFATSTEVLNALKTSGVDPLATLETSMVADTSPPAQKE